jgi:hypothetical protein
MLLGVALVFEQEQQALTAIDERIKRVESELVKPRPRVRLAFAGWRDGRRLYHVAGR